MGARVVDLGQVDRGEQDLLAPAPARARISPARARDKAPAPEFEAVPAGRPLAAYPVARGDEAAVGDRVGPLDGLPRVVLPVAKRVFSRGCQPIAVG